MSDLGWRADGIAKAEAAGGVTLERYRRPGFTPRTGVRRMAGPLDGGQGFDIQSDPEPWEIDEPDEGVRRTRLSWTHQHHPLHQTPQSQT